jgi:hypothetical protein
MAPSAAVRADQETGKDGDSPLAQVPAQAPIVVHIRGIERAKDRLLAMVKAAAPDLAAMLQAKIDEGLKQGLEGRQLKGLAKDGPFFVVVTDLGAIREDPPAVAFVFRITNYKEFRDAILKEEERKNLKMDPAGYEGVTVNEKDIYLVDRKTYAVATPKKELAAQFAKSQPGLEGKLAKDFARQFLETDVGLYVDMAAINKEYGEQISSFRQLMPTLLDQVGEASKMDKNALEMAKSMYEVIFQTVEDSRAFLLTADFRPQGLSINALARVGADSKSNQIIKGSKPASLEGLTKMPAGRMAYLSTEFTPELFKAFVPFLSGATVGGKATEAQKAAGEQMVKAGPRSMMMEFDLPPQGISAWDYQDPAKAAEATLKSFEAMENGATFQSAPIKGKPTIKANAETYRDFKFNFVSITWDFDKLAETNPGGKDVAEGMKKMLGDKVNSWFGTDGKRLVSVSAKDWDSARKLLDDFLDNKNPVGQQAVFQETRKQLPANATMLGLMDAAPYLQNLAQSLGPIFKAQGLPVDIPALKGERGKGYLGIAIVLQPEQGSFEFYLPVTAMREIRKMLQPFLGEAGVQ